MSLSGALTSAVTGLQAQSIAMGAISDNIGNSQTAGYKRVDTEFQTLLTVSNAAVHEPGGVTSKPLYTNDVQGTVQQTTTETNLAVSGSGYFAVSKVASVNGSSLPVFEADPLYTRAGDFKPDNNGYLVNSAGYYLNGWAVNPATGITAKNALVQIRLDQLKSDPQPTSLVTYSANLPTNPSQAQNTGPTAAVPGGQTVTFTGTPPLTDGDTMTVTLGPASSPTTKTFVFSDTQLGGGAATATPPAILVPFDSTKTLAQQMQAISSVLNVHGLTSTVSASTGDLTIDGSSMNPVTAVATGGSGTTAVTTVGANINPDIQFAPTKINIFDAQGAAHSIDVTWTQVSGANNTYTVKYSSSDPNIASITPSAPTTVVFNLVDNPATGAKAGSVLSINGVAGNINTAATVGLTVNYGGSAPSSQPVTFNMGSYGVAQQTTLFTGTDVAFISAPQDGLPPGSFRNLDIDAHGLITLNFDNGARKTEFQVPLVTFSNFNGLQAENGNAYSTTVASGTPQITAAGGNGTGNLVASSTEGSNVDIAAEFTKLIQTQRAYEANSKVITTTNQMLQITNQMVA
ncbi:MAG: flagellar hook-basal body complex protein [Rhodospirillales bacterium]|nr:flagellar hook-basal body complex protein [Rhodospirillales bacterium]